MSDSELEHKLGIRLATHRFLVTIHPETASRRSSKDLVGSILGALDQFPDASIVFTAPNPDPGHEVISKAIKEFVKSKSNSVYVESLGHRGYLSMMLRSTVVIGNSSSGVMEAPIAGVPSIDVGDRQKGRVSHDTIWRSSADVESIRSAIFHTLQYAAKPGSTNAPSHQELSVSGKILATLLSEQLIISPKAKGFVDFETQATNPR